MLTNPERLLEILRSTTTDEPEPDAPEPEEPAPEDPVPDDEPEDEPQHSPPAEQPAGSRRTRPTRDYLNTEEDDPWRL